MYPGNSDLRVRESPGITALSLSMYDRRQRLFKKGDMVIITGVDGTATKYVVTGATTPTTFAIRSPRWYERLWWRVKEIVRGARGQFVKADGGER